jgi:amidohydrolase
MTDRDALLKRIDELAAEMIEVSSSIHSRPELGYREVKAAALMESMLKRHGFTVERPLADIPTALRAFRSAGSGKPAIAFIAEYDALPSIGHGCGHNLIAASAFGASVALASSLEKLEGSVWLYGTPAEEYDGGKIPMLSAGLFDNIDAVMMMHPECIYLVNTMSLALDALQIRFSGKEAHASATPHEGINALDAVILLFNAINALRQQVKPEVRIHGIITKGGTYPNIIPDITEAQIYVRASDRTYLDTVTEKVRNCARGAARATGCRVTIKPFERSMDNLINNSVMAGLLRTNLNETGIHDIAEEDLEPGSTDFGNVSHKVPSLYMYAATAPKGSSLHTREFAKLSITPAAHQGMLNSVKAMALTGLDLLKSPELVAELKKEFSGRYVK